MQEIAVGVVCLDSGEIFLGQDRSGESFGAGLWTLPRWSVKEGQTPTEAILRELRWQFGIHAEALQPVTVQKKDDETFVLMRFTGDSFEDIRPSGNFQDRARVDLSLPLPGYMWRINLPDLEIVQRILSKVPKI